MEARKMTLSINDLRIVPMFVNSLDHMGIYVCTGERVHQLQYMGTLKGRDQLQHLLETVGVDYWLDFRKERMT
jgi:hypothetical protein